MTAYSVISIDLHAAAGHWRNRIANIPTRNPLIAAPMSIVFRMGRRAQVAEFDFVAS